jgi:uncharacterized protein with HEPN domain
MKGPLTDKTRILHILDAIGEVEQYLTGVSYNDFLSNSEKRFATIKQIEIVGEACNNLSEEFKDDHPDIAWKPIRGFRNISTHEYFAVNFQIVWEIANHDLPVLKQQFSEVLSNLPG